MLVSEPTVRRDFKSIRRNCRKVNRRLGPQHSGQMVAIARALACQPKMLLLDEPCEGLAPVIVEQLDGIIRKLKEHFPILLAEQNAHFAPGSFRPGLCDRQRINPILRHQAGTATE